MRAQGLNWWRCQQLAEQVFFCRAANPRKMLEIGPGDYAVTAIFRNFGVEVETVDIRNDKRATYVGDIRDPNLVKRLPRDSYDLVLASEVLEHMNFEYLDEILRTFHAVLKKDGHVVIGLPYHTVSFSYRRSRLFFRGGVIMTGIPIQWLRDILFKTNPFKRLSYDAYEEHHWDLGYRPTRVRAVKRKMVRYFDILLFHHNWRASSGYFVLKKTASHEALMP